MNRKVVKIVSVLMMVLMVVAMLSTSAFADFVTMEDGVSDVDIEKFTSRDSQTTAVFQGFIGTLINIIQIVGMGVAVIMLIVMAIKYISAAPSEKAELKKSITIYGVGAIVLFAASGILQIVKNFANVNINSAVPSAYVEMVDNTYLG